MSIVSLLFLIAIGSVRAIIIPPRSSDGDYVVDVRDFPFFVALGEKGSCAGSIIKSSNGIGEDQESIFVATAAHCLCDERGRRISRPTDVIFAKGGKAKMNAAYINPERVFDCDRDGPNKFDMAVIEVNVRSLSKTIIQLYEDHALEVYSANDEVKKRIEIFGYGTSGDAGNLNTAGKCQDAIDSDVDGLFRRAENIIISASNGLLKYKMDCAGRSKLALEGLSGSGDSGGPATIDVDGKRVLVGVNSGNPERNECDCNTVDQYNRLSSNFDFIENVIAGNTGFEWISCDSRRCRPVDPKPTAAPTAPTIFSCSTLEPVKVGRKHICEDDRCAVNEIKRKSGRRTRVVGRECVDTTLEPTAAPTSPTAFDCASVKFRIARINGKKAKVCEDERCAFTSIREGRRKVEECVLKTPEPTAAPTAPTIFSCSTLEPVKVGRKHICDDDRCAVNEIKRKFGRRTRVVGRECVDKTPEPTTMSTPSPAAFECATEKVRFTRVNPEKVKVCDDERCALYVLSEQK